jgi:hypothetical protein
MVTLFANTFKAPYYEHLMGSSSQHFYDAVRIAERIEQGIKAGRIAEPLEKKGFIGRKREGDINSLEGGYKGKRVDSYNPQVPTSQFSHMNISQPFPPNRTNNQSNNQNHHAFEGHVCQTVEYWTHSSYPCTTIATTIPNLVQA